jgi:hypothetical protein
MFKCLSSCFSAALLLLTTQAGASIMGVTAGIELNPFAIGSLELDGTVSDEMVFAFPEMQGVMLGSDVDVNITLPGTYAYSTGHSPGAIAAGTQVNSYLLHTDRATNDVISYYGGSVTFEQQILGVIISDSFLDLTDGLLGLDIVYPTLLQYRGAAEGPQSKDVGISDFITLSGDLKTLTLDIGVGGWMDQVRVVTAVGAVPEPSTGVLLGLGLLGLAARQRRSAKAS